MHRPTGIFWANLTPFSLQCRAGGYAYGRFNFLFQENALLWLGDTAVGADVLSSDFRAASFFFSVGSLHRESIVRLLQAPPAGA